MTHATMLSKSRTRTIEAGSSLAQEGETAQLDMVDGGRVWSRPRASAEQSGLERRPHFQRADVAGHKTIEVLRESGRCPLALLSAAALRARNAIVSRVSCPSGLLSGRRRRTWCSHCRWHPAGRTPGCAVPARTCRPRCARRVAPPRASGSTTSTGPWMRSAPARPCARSTRPRDDTQDSRSRVATSRRRTLPIGLVGSSSMKTTRRGTL